MQLDGALGQLLARTAEPGMAKDECGRGRVTLEGLPQPDALEQQLLDLNGEIQRQRAPVAEAQLPRAPCGGGGWQTKACGKDAVTPGPLTYTCHEVCGPFPTACRR